MLIVFEIVFLIGLLGLSGFFSGSETALFSLSQVQKEKLYRTKPREGKILQQLLDMPRSLIITILIGNEFVNITFSTLCAGLVIKFTNERIPWLNILIVLPLLLLIGEITPKVLAINKNEKFAAIVARPLFVFMRIITPLRWLIRNISDRIVNLIIGNRERRETIINEDVIRTIVSESEKEGVLEAIEREYIYKVFDFGDLKAEDVMTPRAYLFSLDIATPVNEIIQSIKARHYSKIPIYDQNPDNIIGVLFATDLISSDFQKQVDSLTLRSILRKPYFIPPNKRVDELFSVFQRQKISFAIVIDEYGTVQGVITMEDLLEQIFGEISDEYEMKKSRHEFISDNLVRVQATISLDDFNALMGTNLTSEEVDTLGGYVFSLFGELPAVNATIVSDNLQFIVEKIVHNRIESLIVRRLS